MRLVDTIAPFSVQPEKAYPPLAAAVTAQVDPETPVHGSDVMLPPEKFTTEPLVAICLVIVYAVPAVGAD